MTTSAETQSKAPDTERDAALELWTYMYAHGLDFIPVNRVEDVAGHQAPEVSELIAKVPNEAIVGFDPYVQRHRLARYLHEKGW
ncbi:hypothetical protein SEA_ANON_81 [Gordonia phage Anon]|nr:hypothetical protein SEA_ANON_81 [Gordonia phage Anon]